MEKIKLMFFNEPLRHWHFKNILEESKMSRERVNHFLKELVKDRMVARIKPRGKMPYYVANNGSLRFCYEKRIYGLKILQGLFEHLNILKEVKTAILFGSFARGDWGKSSDIDLFIYGDAKGFEKGRIEGMLGREIQLFCYTDAKIMKKELDSKLIPNIANGFSIKGSLEPFEVSVNA
ncbi:nucleotidyltransferase domain-containing protein [Candidatus Woesearchaeota archaeon]|nr:nucleotidyltransferase domain-containing protein [Candidatus Woesearchaeota archaeon]